MASRRFIMLKHWRFEMQELLARLLLLLQYPLEAELAPRVLIVRASTL